MDYYKVKASTVNFLNKYNFRWLCSIVRGIIKIFEDSGILIMHGHQLQLFDFHSDDMVIHFSSIYKQKHKLFRIVRCLMLIIFNEFSISLTRLVYVISFI